MSETLGLLFGSTTGGVLYEAVGTASPFVFEAACMVLATVAVAWHAAPSARPSTPRLAWCDYELLKAVWRVPGVLLMSLTSGALIAIQTGILVFLYPLFLAKQGHLRPESIGYLISLSVLGRLLALRLGGGLSDRWGRAVVIIPGLLAYGALLGSLTCITHPVLLGAWSLMIGGASGFVATIPTAVVGDRVLPPHQAIAIGWLRTVSDSGFIVGPLIFGALAGWVASILTGRNSRQGCIGNIIVGIIGAFLGGWGYSLFTGRPLVVGWNWTAFIVAVLGAVVLLALLNLVFGRRAEP